VNEAQIRRDPRVLNHTLIEVRFDARDALREVWTSDISKGGLFLTIDDPPPIGSRLEVVLRVPRAGRLLLKAEVVHVIDAAQAGRLGGDPGIGLQFLNLVEGDRRALMAYIEGLSERFTNETGDVVISTPQDQTWSGAGSLNAGQLIALARQVLGGLENEDTYRALGIDPAATQSVVDQRCADLAAAFAQRPADLSPPQEVRIERARQSVARLSRMMRDPVRRLDYDLRHGLVNVEQRMEELRSSGIDLHLCRATWERLFPDRIAEAARHASSARQYEVTSVFAKAISEGRAALEHDPFDEELRRRVGAWERRNASQAI
jgi:hypothetical protein